MARFGSVRFGSAQPPDPPGLDPPPLTAMAAAHVGSRHHVRRRAPRRPQSAAPYWPSATARRLPLAPPALPAHGGRGRSAALLPQQWRRRWSAAWAVGLPKSLPFTPKLRLSGQTDFRLQAGERAAACASQILVVIFDA